MDSEYVGIYSKTGPVEVKCKTTISNTVVGMYHRKVLVVHRSLLSYFEAGAEKRNMKYVLSQERDIDMKRDFLLAPLGATKIIQAEDQLLILENEKSKNKNTVNFITSIKEPVPLQRITLKFTSRTERDTWMNAIIAECSQVYLEDLVSHDISCSENFIPVTHKRIWASILLGDEALRKAYIAPPGSDHIELMQFVVEALVDWIQKLLHIDVLLSYHSRIFVAMFSLLVQDTAARALFFILQPDPTFLADFYSLHEGAAHLNIDKGMDPAQRRVLEDCAIVVGFVDHVRKCVTSEEWRPFRRFLAVVNHPAFWTREGKVAEKELGGSHELTPRMELDWLRTINSLRAEFSWAMMERTLSNTPYLSFHFVREEISEIIDDKRVRKAVELMNRVPAAHRLMNFDADGSAKVNRPHFTVLLEYFRFREVWKIFYVNHHTENPFFDAVHMNLWAEISIANNMELKRLFVPQDVFPGNHTFAEVMCTYLGQTVNANLLNRFGIQTHAHANSDTTVKPTGKRSIFSNAFFWRSPNSTSESDVNASPSPNAKKIRTEHAAIDHFRKLMVDRLVLWTECLVGRNILTAADAPLFVTLLGFAAKDASMRAIFWLLLPAHGVLAQSRQPLTIANFTKTLLSTLSELADPSKSTPRFRSFLVVAEHPFSPRKIRVDDERPVESDESREEKEGKEPEERETMNQVLVSGAAFPSSVTWEEECAWMDKYSSALEKVSWAQLELLKQDTPYFALRILMCRYNKVRVDLQYIFILFL